MANPQAENGHTDIANEIVEALARTRISGTETQLLWVIFRKTYGWHKKEDEISYERAMVSRNDIIFATGRSDKPNQVNNVLGFPYIFRGALDVRATKINEEMKPFVRIFF